MQCSSHKVDNVVIFVLFRSKGKLISAQVCIPVGCVPPAFWPYLPAYTVQAVVSAPGEGGGVSSWGLVVWYPSMH